MAEVGLLPFARIALQVSRAVLPRYRTRFSKRQFTQPQLLAILCLMRYEDWSFREAEVRLAEHRELRQTLGLVSVPDFTTLYRFLKRLDDETIDRAVGETVRRLRGTGRKGRRQARVAVDATGLAQGAVSTFFVRRMHHHGEKPLPWRHWLKWVVVADLDQQFLLSQTARRGPWNDCANLPAVVEAASEQTRIGLVLADAEFDSERNHTYIRRELGAQSVIPAKRGKKTWRIHGVRAEMRRSFPQRLYRRRALIESVFSSVKRKLSARAPGRTLRMQMRQALLLGLSFNLYRLKHRCLFLRMSTEPAYLYGGMLQESIAEGEQALRLDPLVNAGSTFNSYLHAGDYEKFLSTLPVGETARTTFYRGLCLLYMKEPARAAAEFAQAYRLDPTLLHAKYGRAFLYAIQQQPAEGLRYLKEVEQENPTVDGEMLYKMGQVYAQLGDKSSAFRSLRAAIDHNFYCYACFVRDPLLVPLRGEPQYSELVSLARERHESFQRKYF